MEVKMENKVSGVVPISQKRGIPIYDENPSVPAKGTIAKTRRTQLGNEERGLVINDSTGEVLGTGGAIAYEWEEVDKERFVKLFIEGLRQATGLSKAGQALFEIVYRELREAPGQDTVKLAHLTSDLSKSVFYKGLKELLEREFLYQSPYQGTFFVNIRYMFNGDRLAFVNAYHLKGASTQKELPLDNTNEEKEST